MTNFLENKKILLIVSGGIASYKSLDLIRRLQEKKVKIDCILTESAKKFINPITFESLLGNKVYSNLFSLSQEKEMSHIKLASNSDAILVIPCTANFIAKMANGIADDLSLNVLLASNKIKIIAPAMNTNMFNNKAVKSNLRSLSKMNVKILSPKKGKLACGTYGTGKLMEIDEIVEKINNIFSPKELSGLKAVVTAGPSIEMIDPVRFLSNFSSGKQGYEIAKSLHNHGATVTLVTGKTNLEEPKDLQVITAKDAEEFYKICVSKLPYDIFVSAAAISDWKVKKKFSNKIKKSQNEMNLVLKENIDVLKNISKNKNRPKLVIGFSAETKNLISFSKNKLFNKGCDWIIANNVKKQLVFGSNYNQVSFITKDKVDDWKKMKKSEVAKKITKKIVNFFKKNKLIL